MTNNFASGFARGKKKNLLLLIIFKTIVKFIFKYLITNLSNMYLKIKWKPNLE